MDVELRTGFGSSDGVVFADEERAVVDPAVEVGVRYGEGRRASSNFPSCNRAYDTA